MVCGYGAVPAVAVRIAGCAAAAPAAEHGVGGSVAAVVLCGGVWVRVETEAAGARGGGWGAARLAAELEGVEGWHGGIGGGWW